MNANIKVNINLFPKPKRKGYFFTCIFILFIILFTTSLEFGLDMYLDLKKSLDQLDLELKQHSELKEMAFNKLIEKQAKVTPENFDQFYESLHTFLDSLYKDPVIYIDHMHSLLTYGSSIERVSFQNSGEVQVEGSFPSKKEAALFLEQLISYDDVLHAEIGSIVAIDNERRFKATFSIVVNPLEGD